MKENLKSLSSHHYPAAKHLGTQIVQDDFESESLNPDLVAFFNLNAETGSFSPVVEIQHLI